MRTPICAPALLGKPLPTNGDTASAPCDDHVPVNNEVPAAVLQIVVVEIKNDKFKTDKAVQVLTLHPVHLVLASFRCWKNTCGHDCQSAYCSVANKVAPSLI